MPIIKLPLHRSLHKQNLPSTSHVPLLISSRVTRINCLDCIDRTNVVMSRTGVLFLEQVMRYISNHYYIVDTHTNMEEKKIHFGK
jgi:hypothetical protein